MDNVKRYECKLSTNGYEAGAFVMLTDAEVENFNAGEAEPRFVLAEDQTVAETKTEAAYTNATPPGEVAGGIPEAQEGAAGAPAQQ
jgi:hypothetical protein